MQPEEWFHQIPPVHPEPLRELTHRTGGISGLRIGIVLPVCNNARTLGKHLLALRHSGPETTPWDEIAIVDFNSTDASQEIAISQDARILGGPESFLPNEEPPSGLALRRATEQLGCDITVIIPAGLRRIDWNRIAGLVLALLDRSEAVLAIGFQDRPAPASCLALRPLLAALCPELAFIIDPSCPVLAARSSAIRHLPVALTRGYEPALLLDVWKRHGLEGIVQAPVGTLLRESPASAADERISFRATLALLESAVRHQLISRQAPLGQLFPNLVRNNDDRHVHTSLQHFRWSFPETSGD